MFSALKNLLSGDASASPKGPDDLQLASAVLLVEAGHMDGSFDNDERAVVRRVLTEKFKLDSGELEDLFALAEEKVATANEIYSFTRTVKDKFSHGERIQMIEMLWEVVYADGVLDDYEANLVRRIAGLIYVSDVESGDARKRVLAKRR